MRSRQSVASKRQLRAKPDARVLALPEVIERCTGTSTFNPVAFTQDKQASSMMMNAMGRFPLGSAGKQSRKKKWRIRHCLQAAFAVLAFCRRAGKRRGLRAPDIFFYQDTAPLSGRCCGRSPVLPYIASCMSRQSDGEHLCHFLYLRQPQ